MRIGAGTVPTQRPGLITGTVKRCNPLCVNVDGRELGPLASTLAPGQLTPGQTVLLTRLEDQSTLVVVGVLGGTAIPPAGGVTGETNLHVQPNNPGMTSPGLWVQTGLGASGNDLAIWVETGG